MRMWMCNPKTMCNQHLLGEHGELHKFMPTWVKQHSITGRIKGNQIEPMSYKQRHDKLAKEMVDRGFNHKSDIGYPDFSYLSDYEKNYKINKRKSLKELYQRCEACKIRGEL